MLQVFPPHVARQVVVGQRPDAQRKECVIVFYSEIANIDELEEAHSRQFVSPRLFSKRA